MVLSLEFLIDLYKISSTDLKIKLHPITGKVPSFDLFGIHTLPLVKTNRSGSIFLSIAGRRNKFSRVKNCVIQEFTDDFPPPPNMRVFSISYLTNNFLYNY